jgi:hypothetical protein
MSSFIPIIPILIYIIILLIIFIIKPPLLFDKNGIMLTYNPKAMITLDIIYPIIAVLSYYLYLIIKIIFD